MAPTLSLQLCTNSLDSNASDSKTRCKKSVFATLQRLCNKCLKSSIIGRFLIPFEKIINYNINEILLLNHNFLKLTIQKMHPPIDRFDYSFDIHAKYYNHTAES